MKHIAGRLGLLGVLFVVASCQEKHATPSAVVDPMESAPTSQPSGAGGYLLKKTPIAAGDECRYGGTRAEGGMDKDSSGTLEAGEVTSSFAICDGTIESTAKETFKKYVHSIGLVITKSSSVLNGTSVAGGTGWIVGDGLVVTNGHVAQADSSFLATGYKIYFYLPKTQFAAETLLAKGLPNYAGFAPSTLDFDVFEAKAVDMSPYTSKNGDAADFAFLDVPGVAGRAVLPLAENAFTAIAGSSADLSDNGSKNSVNLGDGVFNINYSQVQGPRLSMGTVTTIQTCGAWLKTANASCISEIGIPDSRRLLFWWGYGDHGGSGSPVFDRFGKVAAVFTFGSVPPDTFTAAGQFVGDLRYWLAKPRSYTTLK